MPKAWKGLGGSKPKEKDGTWIVMTYTVEVAIAFTKAQCHSHDGRFIEYSRGIRDMSMSKPFYIMMMVSRDPQKIKVAMA